MCIRDRLYAAAGGAAWGDSSGWLKGDPCGSWHGVSCDATNTAVVGLDLSSNRLMGSVPTDVAELGSLGSVSFGNNSLSGTVPPQLSKLSGLSSLQLDTTSLSGTVPPQLSNLSGLSYLYLDTTSLSGTVPPQLSNLLSLIHISEPTRPY